MQTENDLAFASPPRWLARGVLCALLASTIASPVNAVASKAVPLEECEPALEALIKTLESKGQLSDPRHVYAGPPLGPDYSKCRISSSGSSWPRYAVYRSGDNVTVVIEKRSRDKEAPVLYGPFASAYRK